MKPINLFLTAIAGSMVFAACNQGANDGANSGANNGTPATEIDSISYAYGLLANSNPVRQGVELNFDMMVAGMEAAKEGSEPLITEQEANQMVSTYFRDLAEKNRIEKGAKNLEDGQKFLAENKTKEGVVTTESGLQYKILTEGTGPKPQATDKVTTHYHGTLIDGTVFDSSVDRGQPATFPVNGVIPGWVEALQLMPQGSKWELYIPAELAYGERGPATIGPNSTLIFQVELLSIESGE